MDKLDLDVPDAARASSRPSSCCGPKFVRNVTTEPLRDSHPIRASVVTGIRPGTDGIPMQSRGPTLSNTAQSAAETEKAEPCSARPFGAGTT